MGLSACETHHSPRILMSFAIKSDAIKLAQIAYTYLRCSI
jgi:hypothetical protein